MENKNKNKNIKKIYKKINSNLTHVVYKYKNKIFCFISCFQDDAIKSTTLLLGKPSNVDCLGVHCETLEEADLKAKEYINNCIDCFTNM